MRKRRAEIAEPGQDSFLDIVANLVGILLILIMVIGAQARDAMVEQVAPDPVATEERLEQPRRQLAAAQGSVKDLVAKIYQQESEIVFREKERAAVLHKVALVRQELLEMQSQLDGQKQQAFQRQSQRMALQREYESLTQQLTTVRSSEPEVEVLRHIPTPLAKTVFGKEVHFRLSDGWLTYVPIEELVERFRQEARLKVWKLKDAPRTTESVGPIRGFKMRYTLQRIEQRVPTQAGMAVEQRVELESFTVIPTSDDLGEPLERALQPGSEFLALLNMHVPSETTVTIWIYPDSFVQFRQLREVLLAKGFLTAGRPLPEGQPITGSPDGTRSAAQ